MTNSRKLGKGILVLTVAVLFLGVFSILAETVLGTSCTFSGKTGTCLLTTQCTVDGGTSHPSSTGAKGCEALATNIQCCIAKEDASSYAGPSATATVKFESKPVTLTSDKVFMETYNAKSKIIDASKITSGGKPIFEDAACILDNENPNIGGRVTVTVKVFNNIDEQIDEMTFVMKAGGDLWDYADCGDGTVVKGRCALPGDVSATNGREPKDGNKGEFLQQCKQAYNSQGFGDLFKGSLKTMGCYAPKAASGTKTETKTGTSGNGGSFGGVAGDQGNTKDKTATHNVCLKENSLTVCAGLTGGYVDNCPAGYVALEGDYADCSSAKCCEFSKTTPVNPVVATTAPDYAAGTAKIPS